MGKGNQPRGWLHSNEFISPSSIFERYEVKVENLTDLWTVMGEIQKSHGSRLLWRGQGNHDWGLHNSLFRVLRDRKYDDKYTAAKHTSLRQSEIDLRQYFPTENEMVEAEKKILQKARSEWRLDSLHAMEIFARIQHRGGPSRLIDFSFNPLVALWFAVSDSLLENIDARLFCLALKGPNSNDEEPNIRLDAHWGSYEPKWHDWHDDNERLNNHWGSGSLRRFWVPPIYDNRMLAQNSVFVIDGIPISSEQTQSSFAIKGAPKNKNWRMADLLTSASLYLKFYKPGQSNRTQKRNFASTYSFRIPSRSKKKLREQLENWFGYDAASIYPDVDGLRNTLSQAL